MDTATVAVGAARSRSPRASCSRCSGPLAGAGWLFGARCDEVRSGRRGRACGCRSTGTAGTPWTILGTGSAPVVPDAAIDIEHTQPWRGRIGPALRARRRARRRGCRSGRACPARAWSGCCTGAGLPLPEPLDDGAVRLGAITTASGPGAVYSMSAELMAELAVTEINAEGGVHGRPVQPHRRRRRDRRRPGRGRGRPHGAAGLPRGLRQQHLRLLRGRPATARGPRGPRGAHRDQRGRGRRPHRRPVRGAPVAPSSTPSWAPPWPTGRGAGSSSGRATSGRTGPTGRRGGRSTGPAGRWWARRSHPSGPATSGT